MGPQVPSASQGGAGAFLCILTSKSPTLSPPPTPQCPSTLGASQHTAYGGALPEAFWERWPRHSVPEDPVPGG